MYMEKKDYYLFLRKIIFFSFRNFINLIVLNENKIFPTRNFFPLFLSSIWHPIDSSKIRNEKLFLVFPTYEKVYQILKILIFFHIPVIYGETIFGQTGQKNFLVILRKINTDHLKKIHSPKKKTIFYIETPVNSLDFFTRSRMSSFIFFFYSEKNTRNNVVLNLKKPFLETGSEWHRKEKISIVKRKTIWAKNRMVVAENFFFFWKLKKKNIRKAVLFSPTSMVARKAKFLIYSIGFKNEIIGPWLTKRKILKRLKRFNSSPSGVLILSGTLDFSNYILNRVDTREISFCYFSENPTSNKKKILI